MRKKIVAGNWKMNKNFQEGIELALAIQHQMNDYKGECEVILIPPAVHISKIRELIDHKNLFIGGQNCSEHDSGAYTGEISTDMLWSSGADYVLVGHSERRQYNGETNEICAKKIDAALDNQLLPIYCVGETLEQREKGNAFAIIEEQLTVGSFAFESADFEQIVIAYEPVWAIGTGLTATKEQAQEVHAFIRGLITKKYGKEIAQKTPILYGGSCKPSNADEIFSQPDVDGGLIGGAALNANDFMEIVKANK
jgi:triosephosphate isomerase